MKLVTWAAPTPNSAVADRIRRTQELVSDMMLPRGSSILDIGGCEFKKFCDENGLKYTSLNIATPVQNGTGGYAILKDTVLYDGITLPFKTSFDVVMLNFVLHHAAEHTIGLLKQVKQIAKRYIIIGEDLSELNYSASWHKRNYEHQPGGVYRSNTEWLHLFDFLSLNVETQCIIRRIDDDDATKIYRTVYVINMRP